MFTPFHGAKLKTSIFLIFSEYLHFILGRILDHTRDVPGNILERIAIVNLMRKVILHRGQDQYHYLRNVVWFGMPGIRWENVVPLIHSLINYRSIPFAVIIHCGGNDIGLVPCGELLSLYLVEKNVIGNKRQMHTVLFKQSGVFVIEIRMSWLSCNFDKSKVC
jgi:hypothetical protein